MGGAGEWVFDADEVWVMGILLFVAAAAAAQVGATAMAPSKVDFDFSCEMLLPAKGLATLGGHVSYDSAPSQSNDVGTMKFSVDTTPQKLGSQTVTVFTAGAGLIGGIQQSGALPRAFLLDARPGGNASLIVSEGVVGRKMLALGYCDISGLKEIK